MTQGRFTFMVSRRWFAIVHIYGLEGERYVLRLARSGKDFDIGRVFSGRLSQPIVVEHDRRRFARILGQRPLEDLLVALDHAPRIYVDDCGSPLAGDVATLHTWCEGDLHGLADAIRSARKQLAASKEAAASSRAATTGRP